MEQISKLSSGIKGYHQIPNLPNTHNHKPFLGFTQFGSKLKILQNSLCLSHGRAFNHSAIKIRAPIRALASVATAEKPSMSPEIVLEPIREISGTVKLPGSKSLSNRILLLAAISEVYLSFPCFHFLVFCAFDYCGLG